MGMLLEGWRRIHPDNHHFRFAGIVPTVAAIAFEPEALVLVEDVTFRFIEPDLQFPFQHVDPIFTLMRVSSVAAGAWRNMHHHRFQHLGAGGEKFHTNAVLRLN